MVVTYNDVINAIAKAQDTALMYARARAAFLRNGETPPNKNSDAILQLRGWINILTRIAATWEEGCATPDGIGQVINNINTLARETPCDVSRTYSRHSSSGGGSNPPSGYVERVLGLYVDNTDPRNPIIRIYVNPATISGDGTQTSPFSAIGGGGGAVSSVNGLTGAVVLTTTNIAEGINLYYTNARGIASILTGLSVSGGAVIATDTILQAVGKLQNQINGLAGGVEYQGTWNASTNTPTLTSSVGTQGHYYVVSVAGSTNLNGITDWQLGDWAIFNGTVWQKVDNTDAVVSVNGQTGIVALTTSDISEGTNQYFTTARVLATAITGFSAGAGTVAATDTILQAINKIVGNLASKQDISVEVTGNITAVLNTNYINTANATYTDPTPTQGKGYSVLVVNGTATIGGVAYATSGTLIYRTYHSGAWVNSIMFDEIIVIDHQFTLSNLADATPYFFDQFPQFVVQASASKKTQMPYDYTLIAANIQNLTIGTLGSSENSTLALRINNTTDLQVSNTVKFNALNVHQFASGLNLDVLATDYFESKLTTATFATNPTQVACAVTYYFRRKR